MAWEFPVNGIGPLGRVVGSFIVGRLVPKRWRHVIEPESELADAIGLAVVLAILVLVGALVIAHYAEGEGA